jgi:hypothetical protein
VFEAGISQIPGQKRYRFYNLNCESMEMKTQRIADDTSDYNTDVNVRGTVHRRKALKAHRGRRGIALLFL